MATVAATGTSSQAGREARRRRILERGPDRFALITGRIQSLPPEPDQSRSQASRTPANSAQHEDDIDSGSLLTNPNSGKEPSQRHMLGETEEPLLLNRDNGVNISSREPGVSLAPDSDKGRNTANRVTEEPSTLNGNKGKGITSRAAALLGIDEELSQISSSMRRPAQAQQHTKSLSNSHRTGQVRSAIAATENIRICSSAAAAILVILSYTEFPIVGSLSIRSIVLLRPVFLLLLTNLSIVLLCLLTQGTYSNTRQRSWAPVAGVGKAIEVGLLLQHILAALFMDFSIYAILLICGHSLVQRLGW